MKQRTVSFKKPAKVLQVFRQVHEYGKDEKSFAGREHKLHWHPLESANGYVADGVLYLPSSIEQEKKFGNCDLITIEDAADVTPQQEWKMINNHYERGNHHCFDLQHRRNYEIFWLKQKEALELLLKYSYAYIGDPGRDDFKLATLENNVPVEIRINGKLDTSRGRYYKEQCFIFQVLGVFDSCTLFDVTAAPVVKAVPAERQLVSLVKPLW